MGYIPKNSHKLDISSKRPILGFRLRNFVGGFRLQLHIMKHSLDADDVLLNVASGPHDPVLQNETDRVRNQNHTPRDSKISPERP